MKDSCVLGIIAAVLSFSGTVFGVLSGDGTEEHPYLIQSRADFDEFADPNNAVLYWASGKYTKLMCNLDLSDTTYTQAVIAPDTDNTTFSFQGTPFTGIFDGNCHYISTLTITTSIKDCIGLFGQISDGGRIKNLGVENMNIQGRYYVGGLVGINYNTETTIVSCSATGAVGGLYYVGGLVGRNDGTILSCYTAGSVTSIGAVVGGLVGINSTGTITSCYTTGVISGTSDVGGLVGINLDTILCSYSTNVVSGSEHNVGGLVGRNDEGRISFCYAAGAVSGTLSVGGLVGQSTEGWIESSFWDVETSGQTASGGGIGKSTDQMKDMYTYLDATWLFIYENRTLGEWVMPENDYPKLAWQVYTPVVVPDLKGLTEQEAIDALDAAGLFQGQTYSVHDTSVAVGLVSATIPQSGTTVCAGLTPISILLAKGTKYAGGDGVAEPYQIETVEHFLDMANNPGDWNKSFVLTGEIDLNGLCFIQSPIAPNTGADYYSFVGTKFTGVFDGREHIVSNLMVLGLSKEYVGLLGCVGTNAQIKNLGVENAVVQGGRHVGGLSAYNYNGIIIGCYFEGAVNGTDYVGGFVGYNDGIVTSCYAEGMVIGVSNVGGLVGHNFDTIISSHATGSVMAIDDIVGGLAGYNYHGIITSCHAAGTVSGSYAGGLVGWNYHGTVIRCYSIGKPNGTFHVGGLVGVNDPGSITECYAAGEVSGTYNVGGLVGVNSSGGMIRDSYSTGCVVGSNFVGGLSGSNYSGKIIHCYSTGKPTGTSSVGGLCGTVDTGTGYEDMGNFWDTETSEINISAMGTGKTMGEMKTLATFVDAGWDFESTWAMCEGTNTPRLQWQIPAGDWVCPDGVAMEDLDYFAIRWLMEGCAEAGDCEGADLDGDGAVDLADWAVFAGRWLEGV